jgi:hypothetical protein
MRQPDPSVYVTDSTQSNFIVCSEHGGSQQPEVLSQLPFDKNFFNENGLASGFGNLVLEARAQLQLKDTLQTVYVTFQTLRPHVLVEGKAWDTGTPSVSIEHCISQKQSWAVAYKICTFEAKLTWRHWP